MRALRWFLLPLLVGGGFARADFKNLQVLPKTIGKDELKTLMKAQTKALGVECDFCHETPDMASDKNPSKVVARKMMQMTQLINDKWIKGVVDHAEKHLITCGTCHQGHNSPPSYPPTAGAEKK
jgi:hypothetical protein